MWKALDKSSEYDQDKSFKSTVTKTGAKQKNEGKLKEKDYKVSLLKNQIEALNKKLKENENEICEKTRGIERKENEIKELRQSATQIEQNGNFKILVKYSFTNFKFFS